jgi:hypothetical protein
MYEKPEFPARSSVSLEAGPKAKVTGWRRSADRTILQENSLQTGNLTGKIAISGG